MFKSTVVRTLTCGLLIGVAWCGSASPAAADPIGPGFDLLQTVPGPNTFIDLGGPIGRIDLMGRQIGPGTTDTIIQRLTGAGPVFPDTIPIEIIQLNLVSVNPIVVSGTLYDVSVMLNPAFMSLGMMQIDHQVADGGTFNSFFDVFVELTFTEVGNPSNTFVQQPPGFQVTTTTMWSHTSPPGYPTSPQYPSGGFFPGVAPGTEGSVHVDWIIMGPNKSGQAMRVQFTLSTPEPATLTLLGLGGTALLGYGWRRRRELV